MDVAKWNSVLDRMLELPSFVPLGAPYESDAVDKAKVVSDKKFSRMSLSPDVPRSVQRFFLLSQPSKLWGESFATQFDDYDEVWAMRKHDGWFVGVYVDQNSEVQWQTMGGNILKFIERSMAGFLAHLRTKKGLKPNHAFKIEFTVREAVGDDYKEVRSDMGMEEASYVGVIVDYFDGYSQSMDREVVDFIKGGAKLTGDLWRRLWFTNGDTIKGRLDKAMKVLEAPPTRVAYSDDGFKVEVASVEQCDTRNKLNIVPDLAKRLCNLYYEGFVLHCYKHAVIGGDTAQHKIFKLKLEQLGDSGISVGYEEEKFLKVGKLKPTDLCAGRQFLVRCLGAECHPVSYIPHHLAVGYFDDDLEKYVVTDLLKLRGVPSGLARAGTGKRYALVRERTDKHEKLTAFSRSMANIIACVAESLPDDQLISTDNLEFSSKFRGESSGSMINLSKAGILLAGGANLVWASESGNYHMDAAVVKRMTITEGLGRPNFGGLQDTGTDFDCLELPEGAAEWSKSDWAAMTDLMAFNKSDVLFRSKLRRVSDILSSQNRTYRKPVGKGKIEDYRNLNVWLFGCFQFINSRPSQSIPSDRLQAMKANGVNLLNVKAKGDGSLYYEMQIPSAHHDVDIIMVNKFYCNSWRISGNKDRKVYTEAEFQHYVTQNLRRRCVFVDDRYSKQMASGKWKHAHSYVLNYDPTAIDMQGESYHVREVSKFLRERQLKRRGVAAEAGPAPVPPVPVKDAGAKITVTKESMATQFQAAEQSLNSDCFKGITVYIHSSPKPDDDESNTIDYIKGAVENYSMVLSDSPAGALVFVTGGVGDLGCEFFLHYLFFNEFNLLRYCMTREVPEGFGESFKYEPNSWKVSDYLFVREGTSYKCSSHTITSEKDLHDFSADSEVVAAADRFHVALNQYVESLNVDDDTTTDEQCGDEDEPEPEAPPAAAPAAAPAAPPATQIKRTTLQGKNFHVHNFSKDPKYDQVENSVLDFIRSHGGSISPIPLAMDVELIVSEKYDQLVDFNVCIGFDRISCIKWDALMHPQYFAHLEVMLNAHDIQDSFHEVPNMCYYVFRRYEGKYTTRLPNGRKNITNKADFDLWMSQGGACRNFKRAEEILRLPFVADTELKSRTYVWAIDPDRDSTDAMNKCMQFLRTKKCALICTEVPYPDHHIPVLFHQWPPPSAFQNPNYLLVHSQYITDLESSKPWNLDSLRCHPQDIYSFQWRNKFESWNSDGTKIKEVPLDICFWRNVSNKNYYVNSEDRAQHYFNTPRPHVRERQYNVRRQQELQFSAMLQEVPPEESPNKRSRTGEANVGGTAPT